MTDTTDATGLGQAVKILLALTALGLITGIGGILLGFRDAIWIFNVSGALALVLGLLSLAATAIHQQRHPEDRGQSLQFYKPVTGERFSEKAKHWGNEVLYAPGVALFVILVIFITRFQHLNSANYEIVLLGALLAPIGLFIFSTGFADIRRRQLILDTPTSDIRSMAQGTVELQGSVRSIKGTAPAPVTGKDSVLYTATEYETNKTGDGPYWTPTESKEHLPAIVIDDGTGQVLIDPGSAELNIQGTEKRLGAGETPPTAVQQYFGRDGPLQEARRYTERSLQPGDSVYVFGAAERRQNLPGDHDIVVTEDKSTGFFFITDQPEEQLVNRFSKGIILQLVGGLVLTLIGITGVLGIAGLL